MQMIASLRSNTLGIAIFAAATAALIATTYVLTKDRISDNIRQQAARSLYEIVPRERVDNDLPTDKLKISAPSLGREEPIDVNIARKDGQVVAVIFPVIAPDGYSGNIDMLVGINANGSVAGARVLAHKETPGLGDKIDLKKSDWILSLNDTQKRDDQPWGVKKDGGQFDQFTGATITPRAVVNAVGRTVDYFKDNRQTLLAPSVESSDEQ